jgi:hypothetical protein
VEAISNGITAFREPKSRNAATTMLTMSILITINFIGIVFFAGNRNVLPQFEILEGGHIVGDSAVLPYMTQALFGGNSILHWMLVIATMLILMMAANTSFVDFPRLCNLHAGDGFLPRQLTFKGSRLTFSHGDRRPCHRVDRSGHHLQGSTSALIPLYAIGVFLSFSMSQAGMVLRWRKISRLKPGEERQEEHSVLHYDRHWRVKMAINAIGAVMSFIVMVVFAVTKFAQGAWVTVILIPTLVLIFFRIHHHYKGVAHALSLSDRKLRPHRHDMLTIVMIDDVHVGAVQMVDFAMSEGNPWIAVHFDDNPAKTERIVAKWTERMSDSGHDLTLVPCPYRNLSETRLSLSSRSWPNTPIVCPYPWAAGDGHRSGAARQHERVVLHRATEHGTGGHHQRDLSDSQAGARAGEAAGCYTSDARRGRAGSHNSDTSCADWRHRPVTELRNKSICFRK